jgi:hypothetical protein
VQGGLTIYQKTLRREGQCGKKSRREECRKVDEIGDFMFTDTYMRRMLQKIRYSLIVLSSNSIARK